MASSHARQVGRNRAAQYHRTMNPAPLRLRKARSGSGGFGRSGSARTSLLWHVPRHRSEQQPIFTL
jgi:hypothetical protein